MEFVYEANPARVIFGQGSRFKAAEELVRLGISRAIILATPGHAALAGELAREIGELAAIVYPGAAMHTPTGVTESALDALRSVNANGILAAGGGSTIGLGKAIALRTDLPQLAIPTTFAGSEMTPILGQTEHGVKKTLRSLKVLPETVLYDPDLVATMPPSLSGPSGMNAIAHAVEALYAKEANPIISLMAEESIRALGRSLPRLSASVHDKTAWTDALYGAWLAGTCLGVAGMAIHHKLCHTLGGTFNLDHASIHCLMVPYSAAYNRDAAPEAMSRAALALKVQDAPMGLYELSRHVGTTKNLRDFGLTPADLEKAAGLAMQDTYYNPRPVTREGVLEMLHAAYEGRPPQVA